MADILSDFGLNPKVLAIQAFLFVVTFLILKRLLFARVMSFMTEREAEARRQREAIERQQAELRARTQEYEGKIAAIDKEAYERLQDVLKTAIEARAKIVAEADTKAADEVRAAVEAIQKEKRAALESLRGEIASLSRQAAEKVLDVQVDAAALEAAVRQSMAQRFP